MKSIIWLLFHSSPKQQANDLMKEVLQEYYWRNEAAKKLRKEKMIYEEFKRKMAEPLK